MTDYVTLLGAEQVQRAASSMRESAGAMQRAADTMQAAMEQHTRNLEDLLYRLEHLLEPSVPDVPDVPDVPMNPGCPIFMSDNMIDSLCIHCGKTREEHPVPPHPVPEDLR